jgi:hypothetical protein
MNYTLVILGVILLIVIYILYKVITEKGKVVSKKVDLSETNSPVSYSDLNSPKAARFCFSVWAYVESFTDAPMTLVKVNRDTSDSPTTFFQLDVSGGPTLKYTVLTGTDSGDVDVTKEIMPNFPLQKWVCIMVSFDNKVVDLYIDGKLVRSQQLENSPKATDKNHVIKFPPGGANKGYLAKFERLTSPMDPATAWNKYMEGNGGNYFSRLLSQYGASLTLTKDDLDLRQFTLF